MDIIFKTSSLSRDEIRRLCVGVGVERDLIVVTNTKHPEIRVKFTHPEWDAFLGGVKLGEFDIYQLEK